ncbi:MAG: helix-turn-helix domain-containing protein [Bacteroidota bacterium]
MNLVSRRTNEQRFKKATRNTVTEYIQRVKVEAAKRQLEPGRKTIREVMFDIGYAVAGIQSLFKKTKRMIADALQEKYNI